MFNALILSAVLAAPADVTYVIVDTPPPIVVREYAVPRSVVVARFPYTPPPIIVDGPVVLRPVMPLRRAARWLLGFPPPPPIIIR